MQTGLDWSRYKNPAAAITLILLRLIMPFAPAQVLQLVLRSLLLTKGVARCGLTVRMIPFSVPWERFKPDARKKFGQLNG
jgi:hypothetical protein